jgi:hypothetical protein
MSAWEYEVTELSEGFAATVYDDNGRMVADHLSEEHARLIAAAPELLEAAKLAMEGDEILGLLIAAIEKHGNYSEESTLHFLNHARCARLRLTEALAKAGRRS